ncbi:MAG: outer membrane beta-barrel protein, partial [Micropepsaceae bacterium]
MRSLLLGAAATLLSVSVANAYERNGWYIGLEGGWNMIEDTHAVAVFDPDAAGPNLVTTGDVVFSDGWAAIATVGHHFGRNWRWEVEVGYRANDFDLTTGEVNEWSGMLNVLYDIPLTNSFALSLGVGAGG